MSPAWLTAWRDTQGLGQHGAGEVETFRQRAKLVLADDELLGEASLGLRVAGRRTEVASVTAGVGVARPALGARVVDSGGVDGDRRARCEGATGVHVDTAHDLMAEDERLPEDEVPDPALEIVVQVRPADPSVGHGQADLPLAGLGDGTVLDAEVTSTVDDDSLHGPPLCTCPTSERPFPGSWRSRTGDPLPMTSSQSSTARRMPGPVVDGPAADPTTTSQGRAE